MQPGTSSSGDSRPAETLDQKMRKHGTLLLMLARFRVSLTLRKSGESETL